MKCECEFCKQNKEFEMPTQIVDAAIKGELVLFCGAGISTEGKYVMNETFYSSICNELNVNFDLSFPDLMQKYCSNPNGRKSLVKKIKQRFEYIDSFPELHRLATSFHKELSYIPQIKTIITTNWDDYFEKYCGATSLTIPEDLALYDDSKRHVLKIHGSINNISSIVATKDDYDKCYERLQKGVLGAHLKSILSTKTVVFIGFSFGDEDFNKILDYIKNEMGELYPHIYIVSLDENLKTKLNYSNCTTYITSGTYFIHKLKCMLIENDVNCDLKINDAVEAVLDYIQEAHSKVSEIDLIKYPNAIYTLSFQDGVIHSLERYANMKKTGEYNQKGYIEDYVKRYDFIVKIKHQSKNYWDEAYYRGYLNGLILIKVFNEDLKALSCFPLYFLPNTKIELKSYDDYLSELAETYHKKDQYTKYAKKFVDKNCEKNLCVHHLPY